jgi:DNA-binding NtrC family response regulator
VNTFEIHIPPLRERKDDIPDLAKSLIARHLKRQAMPLGMLGDDVLQLLKNHDWSGNVRELTNALEHAVIMSDGKQITAEDLPMSITQKGRRTKPALAETSEAVASQVGGKTKTLREIELEVIHQVLERNRGDKPRTAMELGIALKTLYNKLSQTQAASVAEAG